MEGEALLALAEYWQGLAGVVALLLAGSHSVRRRELSSRAELNGWGGRVRRIEDRVLVLEERLRARERVE